MAASPPTDAGLGTVRALYEALKTDKCRVEDASLAGDMALNAEAEVVLKAECRLLDTRQFDRWLALWLEEGVYWVPIDPDADPGADQSFFLDDRRRLGERVWRMTDKTAWGIWPPPTVIRQVGGVEAWRDAAAESDVLVASCLQIHYVRRDHCWQTAGRQIHRLVKTQEGWRIRRKTLMLPLLRSGSPNLGWLL